ncbi:MAG: hypothetical protein AB7P99_15530 [Vicinamibacterales bacterium]
MPETRPSTGISGYMDVHYTKDTQADGVLDFHRFVLLITHQYSSRVRFVSELELEHAFVEGLEPNGGELELEQAYVDFLLTRRFNLRAGMLLMPLGIINERHEPPVYYGVERPLVDTVLLPTTWFEVGAGAHGEVGRGWRYRAFVVAPLNAAEFTADGIRDGRQKGGQANAGRVAGTGRVEYVGIRGLAAGVGIWAGSSGAEFRPRFDVPVRILEADVRFGRRRAEGRGQFVSVSVDGAGLMNDARMRTAGVNPNVAQAMRGGYLEGSYRVVSGAAWGDVGVFGRYEHVNTQHRMPDGYVPLPALNRRVWVVGGTYWPDPDIAIKVDYTHQRTASQVIPGPRSINVGVGWWF